MTQFNPIETLKSQNLIIRELRTDDFDEIFTASSDPPIWDQYLQKDRYTLTVFKKWFDEAISNQALSIIDRHTNKIIGSSRYYETNSEQGETSIGYTFLTREYWGGTTNKELKKLMFGHAWKYFDTVWLHIAEDNIRSRKAAEKIGAQLDHIGIKNDLPFCWYMTPKGAI